MSVTGKVQMSKLANKCVGTQTYIHTGSSKIESGVGRGTGMYLDATLSDSRRGQFCVAP